MNGINELSTHREVRFGKDPHTGLSHRWNPGDEGPADFNAKWGVEPDEPVGCFGTRPGKAKSEADVMDAENMFHEDRRDISYGTTNGKFTNADYGAADWHPFKQERGCMAGMFCDAPRAAAVPQEKSSEKDFLDKVKRNAKSEVVERPKVAPHRALAEKQSWWSCVGAKEKPDERALEEPIVPAEEVKPPEETQPRVEPSEQHIKLLMEKPDAYHRQKFDEVYGVGSAARYLESHPSEQHIKLLVENPDEFHREKFDEVYGAGAAARYLQAHSK
jgi:hypothetical protein